MNNNTLQTIKNYNKMSITKSASVVLLVYLKNSKFKMIKKGGAWIAFQQELVQISAQ